jgi:ubiquinone/menaquinone biosynthesis C-methylase UbiE
MFYKKILRSVKRTFDSLVGDRSDEFYWKYKSFFSFNWRSGYLDSNTILHPHRDILINRLLNTTYSLESVLEVGCADGVNLRKISKKKPNIKLEGIDINKRVLEEGRITLKNDGISNVILKYKSAKNLNTYNSKEFDVVFCDAILMYIAPNNIDKVLKNIIRISRKSVLLCEQHTNDKSFYNDKWVHNYNAIIEKIPGVQVVYFHPIPDNIWGGDWAKYGKIIEIKKI